MKRAEYDWSEVPYPVTMPGFAEGSASESESAMADDDLCGHCFSATDAGAVLEAAYASEQDPEDAG